MLGSILHFSPFLAAFYQNDFLLKHDAVAALINYRCIRFLLYWNGINVLVIFCEFSDNMLWLVQAQRLSTDHDRATTNDCSRIVVVDNDDNNYKDSDDDSQRRSHAFSLCAKNERERLLYTSTSHYVSVYTVTSSSSLTNHNRPHSQARFLLMYEGIWRRF